MRQNLTVKILCLILIVAAIWLTAGFLLPIALPFFLGGLLALGAEPAVNMLHRKLKLPQSIATAIGVSAVCILSVTVLALLLAALMRQLRHLSGILPELADAISSGAGALRQWMLSLAERLPEGPQAVMTRFTDSIFASSGSMLEQAAMRIPQLATSVLGTVSEGLLGLLAGIISGYMISGRLPQLRHWVKRHLPDSWEGKYLPALKGLRKALGGWLWAEVKLAGVAFVLLSIGFLLLRVENAIALAGLVTIVDAFPILGVGTVLVPWSLVCLLQGDLSRGIGLLGIWIVVWLLRSVLEPKLVGKGLGLDPLVTLVAIYAGFRLWGITGMLLAPILALAVTQAFKQLQT